MAMGPVGCLGHHALDDPGFHRRHPRPGSPGRSKNGPCIEWSLRPTGGHGQNLVCEDAEVGQAAGSRALGRVDRLADLESLGRSGDDIGHTH